MRCRGKPRRSIHPGGGKLLRANRGSGQNRTGQVGSVQICAGQVGTGEIHIIKFRSFEEGAAKVRARRDGVVLRNASDLEVVWA